MVHGVHVSVYVGPLEVYITHAGFINPVYVLEAN